MKKEIRAQPLHWLIDKAEEDYRGLEKEFLFFIDQPLEAGESAT